MDIIRTFVLSFSLVFFSINSFAEHRKGDIHSISAEGTTVTIDSYRAMGNSDMTKEKTGLSKDAQGSYLLAPSAMGKRGMDDPTSDRSMKEDPRSSKEGSGFSDKSPSIWADPILNEGGKSTGSVDKSQSIWVDVKFSRGGNGIGSGDDGQSAWEDSKDGNDEGFSDETSKNEWEDTSKDENDSSKEEEKEEENKDDDKGEMTEDLKTRADEAFKNDDFKNISNSEINTLSNDLKGPNSSFDNPGSKLKKLEQEKVMRL